MPLDDIRYARELSNLAYRIAETSYEISNLSVRWRIELQNERAESARTVRVNENCKEGRCRREGFKDSVLVKGFKGIKKEREKKNLWSRRHRRPVSKRQKERD